MQNALRATFVALLVVAVANPAMAQFAGGGDVPFRAGMSQVLNWVFFLGVVIALASFLGACIFLLMRNFMGFAGGVVGVVVGGALMAKAPAIVSKLTTLQTGF